MKNTLIIIGSLMMMILQAEGIHEELKDEIGTKILYNFTAGPDRPVDKSWLNEETKPIVLAKLLKIDQSPDKEDKDYAEACLVELGHAETIRRLVDQMIDGDRQSPLEMYATAEALPFLMHGVDVASSELPISEPGPEHDVGFIPIRSGIAHIALQVIWYREKTFPLETREWAEHLGGNIGLLEAYAQIDLLKQWWQHNKTAILDKRYADAKWLPLYKGRPSYLSDEEIKDRKADQERQRMTGDASPNAVTAAPVETAKNSSTHPFWITFAVLGLLLIAWAGWKFKSRRLE